MSVRVVLSLLMSKKRDVFDCKWNIIYKFATSEGRNPWVKKAFLALSHKPKSPISKQRDEDNATLILFCIHRVQPTLYPQGIYDSVGYLFLSSFLRRRLAMPRFMMSATSLYAFLVYIWQTHLLIADFGRLVGMASEEPSTIWKVEKKSCWTACIMEIIWTRISVMRLSICIARIMGSIISICNMMVGLTNGM